MPAREQELFEKGKEQAEGRYGNGVEMQNKMNANVGKQRNIPNPEPGSTGGKIFEVHAKEIDPTYSLSILDATSKNSYHGFQIQDCQNLLHVRIT